MKKDQIIQKTPLLMNKTKGQHFLVNQDIIKKIVEKSAIKNTDVVLEIGPGNGNLTHLLLQNSKKVVAVEVDTRMISELMKRFSPYSQSGKKLTILQGDAIKTNWPFFDLCVANLPYQISSPVLFKLLSHRPQFRCAVLMVQLEFAQRMVAQPGTEQYCRLSVNLQLIAKVDHLFKVGKKNFKPPPKVESAVVRVEPKHPLPDIDFIQWDQLLKFCFNRKNKTLGAIFKTKSVLKTLYGYQQKFKNNKNLNIQTYNDITFLGQEHYVQQDNNMEFEQNIEDLEIGDNDMEMEIEFKKKKKIQKPENIQLKTFSNQLQVLLRKNGFDQKRSAKLHWSDFLSLLLHFNENNIYFKQLKNFKLI